MLIVTLSFSRYQFVWPTFSQTTEAVCEGLDAAWRFFGGVPKTIVPDNMKSVVARADTLSPTLVESFVDYVQDRGVFVDPARVRSPQDKPRVENQVAYVRENWFDGERFTSLDDARRSAETWCRDIAGRRVHGTTRKVPAEVFETIERPALLPAPEKAFDLPVWADAKVHPDHHIQVARALYSVPTRYVRKQVRARADRTTVKIYFGTELIKVHPRQPPGGRSTDPRDYPVGKAVYPLWSVDALLANAQKKGLHVGLFAEELLSGPLPWSRMRQAYALLRLCDKYGEGHVEAVCQSARFRRCRRCPHRTHAQVGSTPRAPGRHARQARFHHERSTLRTQPRALRDALQQGGRPMKTPTINPELVAALKRLRLGRIAETLPDRLVLADKQSMSFDDLLLLIITDEISRRDATAAQNRASAAALDPSMTFELFDKTAKITYDRRMLAELASLRFLEAHRHVVILGPVGVGKTFAAAALLRTLVARANRRPAPQQPVLLPRARRAV